MNQSPAATSDANSRLVQVLDNYLAALQTGTAPNKDDLLALHPDLADDLRTCLASLDFIRRAAVKPTLVDRTGPDPSGVEPPAGVGNDRAQGDGQEPDGTLRIGEGPGGRFGATAPRRADQGAAAIAKLSENEQEAWRILWTEVERVLQGK